MLHTTRARWALLASLLLIAAFAAGLAADFVHTDDGCAVELHCLACVRGLMTIGVAAATLPDCPSLEPLGQVAAATPAAAPSPEAPVPGSRAPPLA
jgi:hypothetical protein